MLIGLSIRDIVLIERLSLSFGNGLSVLTGETGAGKSILLDALGLALGGRADSSLVRHGAVQAVVVAEFELPADHPATAILIEQDIETADTLVLRRTLTADGRSRAFLNDQPVGVALLRRLGETLVEVHGQFDTQGLLNPQTHRGVLDAYGQLTGRAAAVAACWNDWQRIEEARRTTAEDSARARAEEDYLRYAVAELDSLDPKIGEEATLAESRAMLMHREKLAEAMRTARGELTGERGAEHALAGAHRVLARVADKAGGRLDPIVAALDRAAAETADAVSALQALAGDIDLDGDNLDKLEERLFALRAAARKHSLAVDALPALRTELARRLSLIENQGDQLTRLGREAERAREAFLTQARQLSEARRSAALRLDKGVARELAPLKMDKARFTTAITDAAEAEWGAAGIDKIAFTVTTNPGAPPGPINKIASGGELARFMLALKVVLAEIGTVPTLVFDEVDTGIGGAVAAAVGERLARLGANLQILVVTHSPQVAARGHCHLQVRKRVAGGKTVTDVGRLDEAQRREEIARMLSGATITAEARAAADSLIAGTG